MITSILAPSKLVQTAVIGTAVIAVAIADVFLKKATLNSSLDQVLRSPWLWCAVGLYLLQIGFFTYAFVAGWQLSHLGSLQTVLYALIVLAAGVLIYQETVTSVQVAGIVFAVIGVVLITWR